MEIHPQIKQLEQAVSKFKTCIQDLPESKFLQPIHRWTPRDVLAHLIGWNRLYIDGLQDIRKGEEPSYFADDENDFSNVNAASVAKYAATDRELLLIDLQESSQALQDYLLSLDPNVWNTDFGVLYQGSPTTIENEVAELIKDYEDHREEIEAWATFN